MLELSLVSVPADPDAIVRSNDVAAEDDLRASPMGQGAKKITIATGDRSVTYEYGADAPQERAWPATRKGTPTMPKTNIARGARAARSKRDDDTKPTVDKDGYWVNANGDYCDADGKKSDEPMKADRAAPTVDKDGYWVNKDGDYSDDLGNKVDEPILAEASAGRAMPAVDDDGYYVDEEGNYVDEDGEPQRRPRSSRTRHGRRGRTTRAIASSAASARLSRPARPPIMAV